jgi:hypothetical protein
MQSITLESQNPVPVNSGLQPMNPMMSGGMGMNPMMSMQGIKTETYICMY